MRKITFWRLENGTCPVEDFLDSLSDKQTEKVFFVLDLIEAFDTVPVKFFKKLEATDDIWEGPCSIRKQYFSPVRFF
jgi:hypothetical protein